MYALITGASSGIGRDMAYLLAEKSYDLILVARRVDLLEKIKIEIASKYQVNIIVYDCDLTNLVALEKLSLLFNQYDIHILINNAGFGKVGNFSEIKIEDDLNMIDLNIKSLHYLTKAYITSKQEGYILNVSSLAGFQPGPSMATYYATKAYVLNLSRAISYELKKLKKQIKISILCPGPVKTEFDQVADVEFSLKGISSMECAKKAINGMFKGKKIIFSNPGSKFLIFFAKIVPISWQMAFIYRGQKKKR